MPVLAVTATYDRYYNGDGATAYTAAHDAASAAANGSTIVIGQSYNSLSSPQYRIWRGAVHFNTASIPSDAAVISATLSLYGLSDASTTDFNVTIVNGSALSNPAVNADYGGILAATASGGSINTSTWSLSAYNEITLNVTGLGFITKAGTTKLALKSSRDINSNVPADQVDEDVGAYGTGVTNPAKLTVSYEAKGNLFVKAANLHYVDYNGVERYVLGTAV